MEGGHEAVLQSVKNIYPDTMSYEDWVRKKGTGHPSRKKGWNNLSIASLLTRK